MIDLTVTLASNLNPFTNRNSTYFGFKGDQCNGT